MPSRCILVILDGIGDRYHRALGGTPLQAAHTPNLDSLAARGACGLFHADLFSIALSSPEAHMAMYGYQRRETPARSILEALGSDIPFDDEQVLLCARLGSVEQRHGSLVLKNREPEADEEEISTLIGAVRGFETQGVQFRLEQTSSARHILILTGEVSHEVTDSDPHREGVPMADVVPLHEAYDEIRAQRTAHALRNYLRWSFQQLSAHDVNRERALRGLAPINAVLTYFPGKFKCVPSMEERWGMKSLSVSSKPVQRGIARFLGMDYQTTTDSGDPENDIADRINLACSRLNEYDLIHVHTMAPDDAAHTKDPVAKKNVIEALDRGIGRSVGPLLSDPSTLIVITSDHSTPSCGRSVHSGEAVPLVFVSEWARKDQVMTFDEVACSQGALGTVRGRELMYLILDQLDRGILRELRYSPEPRPYFRDDYAPLRID